MDSLYKDNNIFYFFSKTSSYKIRAKRVSKDSINLI